MLNLIPRLDPKYGRVELIIETKSAEATAGEGKVEILYIKSGEEIEQFLLDLSDLELIEEIKIEDQDILLGNLTKNEDKIYVDGEQYNWTEKSFYRVMKWEPWRAEQLALYQYKDEESLEGIKLSVSIDFNTVIYTNDMEEQGQELFYGLWVDSLPLERKKICVDYEDTLIQTADSNLATGVCASKTVRIVYNPKVSYKTIIPEQKVETIGSKYPFFVRNGQVKYKEFQVGGLIATLPDELEENQAELMLNPQFAMRVERKYREDIEEWLNDGTAKILRTGPEGCHKVRFNNLSLTPIDTLGRRLYEFSATATEIGEIQPYSFVNIATETIKAQTYRFRNAITETREVQTYRFKLFQNRTFVFEPSWLPKNIKITSFTVIPDEGGSFITNQDKDNISSIEKTYDSENGFSLIKILSFNADATVIINYTTYERQDN